MYNILKKGKRSNYLCFRVHNVLSTEQEHLGPRPAHTLLLPVKIIRPKEALSLSFEFPALALKLFPLFFLLYPC